MLDELLTIVGGFEKLATNLAALKALHVGNPEVIDRLETAEQQAMRVAALVRAQIDALNGNFS